MKVQFAKTKLSLASRFAIAAFVYTGVALSQYLVVKGPLPALFGCAGFLLLIVPLFLLNVENFSNKPHLRKQKKKNEDWKIVSMTEVDRVLDHAQRVKKAHIPFIYTSGAGVLFVFVSFCVSLFGIFFFQDLVMGLGAVVFLFICLALIFSPIFCFAHIKKWVPSDLTEKLDAFKPLLTYDLPKNIKLVPYFQFEEDENGKKVPRDARFSLEPVPKPADFIGTQFQIAYNKGPNGNVVYVYAVFICKNVDPGASWQKLKAIRNFPRFIKEVSTGEEYNTVVLRLDTTCRADGYHTKEADIAELVRNVVFLQTDILA
jgi:hypothetical protein